ncbi:NmrA/HSCARG family protein [Streptomyces sp. NPDC006654]|uniref:NmrA/HSCARG family protein n=1 Tax=Streptomyces sp. NPDC006654 TaxID=3156897 RepID=UPI0034043ADD
MTEKKIIAVVGATGGQGGGLARAILDDSDGPFALRALTRDVSSARARELADRGAEVVRAVAGDEASLRKAFDGAYGAFLVTNFWEHMSPDREKQEAAAMARAADESGMAHVIWSTLEDTREYIPVGSGRLPVLLDCYNVPHFDAKAEADRYFIDAQVPATLLRTTFYWENLLGPLAPQRGEDGRLVLALPMADSALSGIAVEDIGRTAYGIFGRGGDLTGRSVNIAGEHLTGTEMAERLTRVLGEEVVYAPVPWDVLRGSGQPGAVEMANMFQFYAEVPEFAAARDLDLVRSLNPRLQSFETWATEHKEALTGA